MSQTQIWQLSISDLIPVWLTLFLKITKMSFSELWLSWAELVFLLSFTCASLFSILKWLHDFHHLEPALYLLWALGIISALNWSNPVSLLASLCYSMPIKSFPCCRPHHLQWCPGPWVLFSSVFDIHSSTSTCCLCYVWSCTSFTSQTGSHCLCF